MRVIPRKYILPKECFFFCLFSLELCQFKAFCFFPVPVQQTLEFLTKANNVLYGLLTSVCFQREHLPTTDESWAASRNLCSHSAVGRRA